MKRRHIFIITVLLAVACACSQRQAGLREYHEALSLIEQGDAPSALKKLEQAAELATTDSLLALAHSQMGTLYFSQRLLDRSLSSYRTAYNIDLRAADTLGLIYDLRDIGNVLRARTETEDSCLAYFKQARQLAIASGNVAMQRDVESQMAAYHLYHNHLTEARSLLFPALRHVDDSNRSALFFMMADLYTRAGQPDSAVPYYEQLLTCGTVFTQQAAHRALAERALQQGNNALALSHLQKYEQLTDSVHKANDAEALRKTAALYDYTQHERQSASLRQRLTMTIALVVILLLSVVALFFFFSRRRMHYQLKVERLEQLLEKYRQQGDKEGVSTAPFLSGTPIRQHIERLLSDYAQQPMNDADWHQLEESVLQEDATFMSRLQEFCRLTPQERKVCLLLKLDISTAGIAQLTAHTKQSVSNTRSRLYEKAFGRKGKPAQWDEFILSL